MHESKSQPKRIRSPWFLGAVVLILLVFLILLQSSNLWKDFPIENVDDTLALYALSSLNFIAFAVFAFILIRNIVKLARERRTLQIGSKIKTRLLIYFITISILPTIAMAFFSYLYLNRSLERWFTQIPGSIIQQAPVIQKQAIDSQKVKLTETTNMLVSLLEKQDITKEKLAEIAERGNLAQISLLSKNGDVLISNEREISPDQKVELDNIMAFIRAGDFGEPVLSDGKGFDLAVANFSDGRKLVVVPDSQPETSFSQLFENSVKGFEALKERETSVRQIGLSTLGLLTFLLIFASTWTAFHIARGLTVPIKALAEGAGEIARGRLGYRVEVLAEDELAMLVTAFNQMSSRLEANAAELQERRRYTEAVLQSLSTGVISFNAQNQITTINKAAIRILKLENADFEKMSLSVLVSAVNFTVLEKLITRAKRIGQASEQTSLQQENLHDTNGIETSLPVALTATALPDAGGVVLVIEDLSELLHAQRASAWSEVARRMAHEIKNPLTPIQLSAERIAKRFSDGQHSKSKVQTFLDVFRGKSEDPTGKVTDQTIKVIRDGTDTILREVDSLKAMVDEFSKFARLPNVKLESGDLNEIIRQSVVLYEDRGAKIETDLAGTLPKVKIDEEQLKRVFVNLIENAVEAFDNEQINKTVLIKTFYDTGRDLVVAEISDNGNGIVPSDFQKLFQPYFSTKGRGTGLGLAIVQRIIIEHGGKIKAVNNSTKGAKFIIELPANV